MTPKLWTVPLLYPNFSDPRWHSGPWIMLHGLAIAFAIVGLFFGVRAVI